MRCGAPLSGAALTRVRRRQALRARTSPGAGSPTQRNVTGTATAHHGRPSAKAARLNASTYRRAARRLIHSGSAGRSAMTCGGESR